MSAKTIDPAHGVPLDLLEEIKVLKEAGEPFAVATVVRTVSLTAAKAGAKAVIRGDGAMSAGWIGGGCARAAVLKAARASLADGKPRLVSVQPGDALQEHGVAAGELIEPAHGHSPGQLVSIEGGGRQAILSADLMHHPLQLRYPDWSTHEGNHYRFEFCDA